MQSCRSGVGGAARDALVRSLVLPNITVMAQLARFTELGSGLVLVLAATEVGLGAGSAAAWARGTHTSRPWRWRAPWRRLCWVGCR